MFDRDLGRRAATPSRCKPNIAKQLRDEAVTQALQTIERRVNELGVAEPIVARHGGRRPDPRAAARRQRRAAREGDHPVDGAARAEARRAGRRSRRREAALQAFNNSLPPDMEVLPGPTTSRRRAAARRRRSTTWSRRSRRSPAATCATRRPTLDENNRPAVQLHPQPGWRAPSSAISPRRNIGKQLAIILDNRVFSAPTIQDRITDERPDHRQLHAAGGAGPVAHAASRAPCRRRLTYLEERTVGPSLGADSIRAGVTASLGGLVLVVRVHAVLLQADRPERRHRRSS